MYIYVCRYMYVYIYIFMYIYIYIHTWRAWWWRHPPPHPTHCLHRIRRHPKFQTCGAGVPGHGRARPKECLWPRWRYRSPTHLFTDLVSPGVVVEVPTTTTYILSTPYQESPSTLNPGEKLLLLGPYAKGRPAKCIWTQWRHLTPSHLVSVSHLVRDHPRLLR